MIPMGKRTGIDRHGLSGLLIFLWAAALAGIACNVGASAPSSPWTPKDVVEPATLAAQLKKSGEKPLLVQVGFRSLYDQGHIPGSTYCGPAFRADGLAKLKECVAGVPRTKEILLYCGCCPWEECPNLRPAFEALSQMGFKQVRVLYIPHNFGRDWAQKGYPTER